MQTVIVPICQAKIRKLDPSQTSFTAFGPKPIGSNRTIRPFSIDPARRELSPLFLSARSPSLFVLPFIFLEHQHLSSLIIRERWAAMIRSTSQLRRRERSRSSRRSSTLSTRCVSLQISRLLLLFIYLLWIVQFDLLVYWLLAIGSWTVLVGCICVRSRRAV